MQYYDEELKPQRNSITLPVIANLGFLVFTVSFIWWAFSYYQESMSAVSMNESRFITTEWYILQELKAQTDQKLLEKDREIADLRRQYLELAQGDADPVELRGIEAQLRKAGEEREVIASSRLEIRDTAAGEEPLAAKVPSPVFQQSTAVSRLLQEEIETMEALLGQYRLRIEKLSGNIAETEKHLDAALAELGEMKKAADRRETFRIEDLKTGALLQAIVNSPEVRAVYPDLSESMERYLRVYALQSRLEGLREAYTEALQILEGIETKGLAD